MRARLGGEVFVLARERVEHVLGEEAEVLAHFPGEAIAGTCYTPPFDYITDYGPRGHTVLLADFVSTDEGTGLVHTAIAFGEDDFRRRAVRSPSRTRSGWTAPSTSASPTSPGAM